MRCMEDWTPHRPGRATMGQRQQKVCARGILEGLGAQQPRNLSPGLEAPLMAMSKVPQSSAPQDSVNRFILLPPAPRLENSIVTRVRREAAR